MSSGCMSWAECYGAVILAQSESSYIATDDQYGLCVFTFQKFL